MPGFTDPAMAEAHAMYLTVVMAMECCFREITVESDCSAIVDLVK
ncbi:hypothetical protein A2U01_0116324, partial [Trifolium medium]|nr:hypothetical protein [Trifolium medium]